MATKKSTLGQIREHMPVVCSNGGQFATVDGVDGDYIKLTKDDRGQHHWIPTSWVTRVDEHVHVDRPGDQAMREWMTSSPTGQQEQGTMQQPATQTMPGFGAQGMEGQEGGATRG